jgi:hypothetical protein
VNRFVVALGLLACVAEASAAKPPKLSLVELRVKNAAFAGKPAVDKVVRVARPASWEGELEPDGRSLRLVGPEGEGELLIAAAGHPAELGPYLEGLRRRHPGSAPSPPEAAPIPGIKAQRGERATRFVITGHETGEMVMIERGSVIVLFAAVVEQEAWAALKPALSRCYATVEVADPKP